ncbi:LLM class flavin-dependent oxidoreductase [Methylobacterium brachiatum]|uniref:LLM class flavin-dependent oxidoreductase n=1 Tax=Methylobacterium brachiatum TaxID=269660 RepID=UPI000EFB91AC|nr:LLM class flavin-dependent oxidoreductase [Methylobacterium brachiatum]AYO83144.1 LLM class flavin-dependent oxidoreductase [Methylobacterium brachiatum]
MADAPRFGIWAAVHGSRAAHHDPDEPDDASWERNRALVLEAEALGFDSVLVAQHTMNPYDENRDQLEAWTAAAALAALTRRIEIIAAIKPGLYHPVVLAKMALQIEHVSGGRFALNLVNAWNRAEFERAGLPFPAHDDRYAYGREWIALVDRLMRGERVTFAGAHFRVQDYQLRPAGTDRPRPRIYLGGESEPARALAADHADIWFINGQPLADVRGLIADVASRPAANGPLRYGLSAFVIARETDAAAEAEHDRLLALAQRDAALRADTLARTDTASVMFAKTDAAASRHVGTNGGTAAGLVGSYETVAARIRAFHAAGIGLFMLQFQPFEAEMRRFAEQILPRVR